MAASKYVTTTTDIFAGEISKINKNVFVFPNAINPKDPQFNEPTEESDRVRFGWLGGSSHLHDLELIRQGCSKMSSYKDKIQFVVCGFDTRGTITEINSETGEQENNEIGTNELVIIPKRMLRPRKVYWVGRVSSTKEETQLVMNIPMKTAGGTVKLINVLIDTGAQANLIKKGTFEENELQTALFPLTLIAANGDRISGGEKF